MEIQSKPKRNVKEKYLVKLIALSAMLFAQVNLAQQKVVVIPLGEDNARVYEIGETGPAGGIVFHITNGGRHGLEASHEDQSASQIWGCNGTDVPNIVNLPTSGSPDPNTGAHNTLLIVIACGLSTAAGDANNYPGPNGITTGWYLPNKEELNLLYLQRATVGDFAEARYISSSEISAAMVWAQDFTDGSRFQDFKNLVNRVRAVRAF